MGIYVEDGFWMVLVPGAKAYLQYQGNPNPKASEIYQLLDELGFLRDVDRTPQSIHGTIGNRLRNQYRGMEIKLRPDRTRP